MITECQNTKSALLSAERTDQAFEKVYAAAESSGPATNANFSLMDATDAEAQSLSLRDQFREESTLVLKGCVDLGGDTSSINLLQEAETWRSRNQESDFQTVESLSDDHFLHIAQHIRTQKTVSSYALIVLDERHEKREALTGDVPVTEPKLLSNLSRKSSRSYSQGAGPHLGHGFSANDEANYTSSIDERSSQRDESESGLSNADTERASVNSTDHDRETHVRGRTYSYQGTRHAGNLRDSRPKRTGADDPGTGKRRVIPEAFDPPRSRPYAPRNSGNAVPGMANDSFSYNIPPFPEQPLGYEPDERGFVLPQRQGNFYQQNSPYHSHSPSTSVPASPPVQTPNAVREDPEIGAMRRQLAHMKMEQERREAEARQKELEARIREEAETAFSAKLERLQRDQ